MIEQPPLAGLVNGNAVRYASYCGMFLFCLGNLFSFLSHVYELFSLYCLCYDEHE